MKIYEAWQNLIDSFTNEQMQLSFWNEYYVAETEVYKKILSGGEYKLSGVASEVAEKLGMEPVMLGGFLDGANTSFVEPLDLDTIEETTVLDATFDLEKLYYNMLSAKAKWLYTLPEWDSVLTAEKRDEILRTWRSDHTAVSNKIGRNEPCPCGSGKKYKNCCGRA